ncbi:type VII secretion target [Actinophytocola sp. NPDC049390]|uniref:type VII secretion target n=1 Tax=Actinophytocola sp. NPDC049390 TaxID=3363894 RepID=UPI0037A92B55
MAPPKTFTIKPDELYAHARAVAQIQHPFDYLRAATKTVCPDGFNVAYGVYCQVLGAALIPAQERAQDAIGKMSTAVDGAVEQLLDAVDTYVHSDGQASQKLRELGAELSSNAPNKLIKDGTTWDWKNYNPLDGGPMTNMEPKNLTKGAGIVGDVYDLYTQIHNSAQRNYATMAGHVASISVNAAAIAGDPVGVAVASGAGWVMEHIKPFKLILDGLAGNPDMVNAASDTWKNIAGELDRLAGHYTAAVKHGTGNWNGDAGASYRDKFASPIVDALKSSAVLANALSIIVGTAGELVNMVRSLARDLTAEAIGILVVEGLKKLGYKPPMDEIENVLYTLKTLKGVVSFLIVFVDEFARQIQLLLEAYKAVSAIIPKLNGV